MATHTIPLRREFNKTSRNRKAKKAITGIKEYVVRHAKVAPEYVIIGEELNEHVWAHGMANPPAKVQVEITKESVKKDDAEYTEAYVNLVGIKRKKAEAVQKKNVLGKQTLKDKLSGAVSDLKSAGKSTEESAGDATEIAEPKPVTPAEPKKAAVEKDASAKTESAEPQAEKPAEKKQPAESKEESVADKKPAEKSEAPKAEQKKAESTPENK